MAPRPIGHLKLAFSEPDCSAAIGGTSGAASHRVVAVTYSGKTGKLTILSAGGNLHGHHVYGCARMVGNGDPHRAGRRLGHLSTADHHQPVTADRTGQTHLRGRAECRRSARS